MARALIGDSIIGIKRIANSNTNFKETIMRI